MSSNSLKVAALAQRLLYIRSSSSLAEVLIPCKTPAINEKTQPLRSQLGR